ncbi:MAG TPA: hypothetical protein VML55_16255 [Planctomycetaceae bacterium]|nr:hypothetical protein [Planctomycetaceae bacterium]
MRQGTPVRLAMWSGPRNISTAMMRSWGNRPDTFVCDEPLYAHYLKVTGKPHPGAAEIIAQYENDWRRVVDRLTGEIPEGKAIFFQKHMAHHLLPGLGRDWLHDVTNCFLIRDPREMLTSLLKILPEPRIEDTGLPQQVEIFELVRSRTGAVPPVLDARDVLDNPRALLGRLCELVGVDFDEAMLSWPPGRRETDGLWARDWYHEVEKSTSFRPYAVKSDELPPRFADLCGRCVECYARLAAHRLRA